MNNVTHPFDPCKSLAGRKWLRLFLKRHHEIANRKAQSMNPDRASKLNRFIVNDHFQKFREILLENGLMERMEVIYNIDKKKRRLYDDCSVIRWLEHFAWYKVDGKALLIFDGTSSSLDANIVRVADQFGIILYCLPSNTIHELQPLDKSVFKSLEPVWARSVIAPNIVSGFRAAGIYSFDPHKIPDEAFPPSAVTEMLQEDVANAENVNDFSHSNDTTRERNVALINEQEDNRKPNTHPMRAREKTNVKGTGECKDTAPRKRKMARLESIHKVQNNRESLGEFCNPSTSGMNVMNDISAGTTHVRQLIVGTKGNVQNAFHQHVHMIQPAVAWNPGCVDESLVYS
ncbi:hypothetical protein PR048_017564 [Dryococelus australis]|uniref:DDE-1 domain-containing protein n=1 Tax=Dryococelus australis TaxID=614101 RepID=A0ABQ9HA48_9NEOP|nr:hypothetical protein PR048_017564 [Dryococelus australis]